MKKVSGEEQEKIIERIQKLLRVADKDRNTHLGEIETALSLAQAMLRRHGLAMADVLTDEEAKEGSSSLEIQEVVGAVFKSPKVPKWMTILISVVNQLTETRTIIQNFVPRGKTYGHVKIIFIGTKEDISVANELFEYLRNSVTRLSSKHQREVGGKFQQWRSFAEGCVCKLMQRTLDLKNKWSPEKKNNPMSVDNFCCTEEDLKDLEEYEDDEELDDIDDGGEEEEFSEETEQRYEIMIADKTKKIEDYIHEKEVEQEHLSTSANLDRDSYEDGSIQAETISLQVHKMVGSSKKKK